MEIILKVKHICKEFGATKALDDVSMELRAGEVRGLIGENGSGKSTLSNIIAGTYECTSGSMEFLGNDYRPHGILDSARQGIALLAQETGTISGMTVAENMFLGEEKLPGRFSIVSAEKMNSEAKKILQQNGLEQIDPTVNIERYSFEDRKMIEVARAVHRTPKVLIVDETTTALTHYGRQKIYTITRKMKEAGNSVIFISHDLEEIMSVCDTVTVLRDGKYIDTLDQTQMNKDTIRSLMIGREFNGVYYRSDWICSNQETVVLRAAHIYYKNILKDVGFELHRGEILGIGDLTESGMHELCKIVFGALPADSGSVTVKDNVRITSPRAALENGIAYIPKDRDTESLFIAADIRDNIAAASYDHIKTGCFILPSRENRLAKDNAELLQVKMSGVSQYVSELSGGNKQKVAIAKWLANDSEIFLMDCPTRGIDIGVKANIYRLMEKLKAEGKSILMVSEELTELIGMSDRILILKDGVLTGEYLRQDRPTEQEIIRSML